MEERKGKSDERQAHEVNNGRSQGLGLQVSCSDAGEKKKPSNHGSLSRSLRALSLCVFVHPLCEWENSGLLGPSAPCLSDRLYLSALSGQNRAECSHFADGEIKQAVTYQIRKGIQPLKPTCDKSESPSGCSWHSCLNDSPETMTQDVIV